MSEGDEEQRRSTLLDDFAEGDLGVDRELREVRVREHAALRASGRPRGVDEGRDVVALGKAATALDFLVRDLGTAGHEGSERPVVHAPHKIDAGEVALDLRESLKVRLLLGEDGARARVLQRPVDLQGRGSVVHGHHHGARVEDREVDERPLVLRLANEGDLVARLDAGGDEALREGHDGGAEIGRALVSPAIPVGQREEREVWGELHPALEQVAHIEVGVPGNDEGSFDKVHGSSFDTWPSADGWRGSAIGVTCSLP